MTHVFTLALADVPTACHAFPDAVAFALYVDVAAMGDASDPDVGGTEVVALSAGDIARGLAGDSHGDLPAAGVRTTTFEVPAASLDRTDKSEVARALRALSARAGGTPTWLQEPQDAGDFVLQLDARFAPLNLGDRGVMYVFRDAAFWQSR
jgi:hypothetical protein